MAGANSKGARPIIIVKKKGHGGHGHHGGAWKVAYADFVTAMMAFFLVMWLCTAVNKEQRAAIFDYFKNPSMEPGKSSKPAPGQMGPGGASTSVINMGGGLDAMRTRVSTVKDLGATAAPAPVRGNEIGDGAAGHDKKAPQAPEQKAAAEKRAREEQAAADHRALESLMAELREAVSKSQALEPFKDQLLLDITPEGVRIQIVDAQNRPMFDVGSARLRDYTVSILRELAKYLGTVPNRISLTGHTDTLAYGAQANYTNWELSADRANAARRALMSGGLVDDKIARVVGLASSVLFDKTQPHNPINRRISIIVMTKAAEEAALKSDTATVDRADAPDATATPTEPAAATPAAAALPTATSAPAPAG
ncbi:MAG TPA: flagellar motor protein MotB [Steroidobacteraceae bacterium]|nr:flagellar motor protein MotB [Steroidobacteraceae bacterium]